MGMTFMEKMTFTAIEYYENLKTFLHLYIYFKYIASRYKYTLMVGKNFLRLVKKKKIIVSIQDDGRINVDNEYIFDDAEDAFDYVITLLEEN